MRTLANIRHRLFGYPYAQETCPYRGAMPSPSSDKAGEFVRKEFWSGPDGLLGASMIRLTCRACGYTADQEVFVPASSLAHP